MKQGNIIQAAIILVGLATGAYFSNISYQQHEQVGHGGLKAHAAMNHGILDISKDGLIPEITAFKLVKDPMSGWNVYLEVDHFTFTPENASQAHRQGEGHAHLYLNGSKIARLYGQWFHIPELIKATNELKVTLNSNDHQTLAVGEEVIEEIIYVRD